MIVLSLFDGISCGQLALERAGIKVDKYYSSEIDEHAIKVTQKNYPNTIQLGDVTSWRDWEIDWASVDLIIGGSPCQGFSFAGNRLNFEDVRSKLFFIYVDILNHTKKLNKNVKFLLENVRMKKEFQDIISKELGVNPILINSNLVSAQNRPRLYWCNWNVSMPTDKNIILKDILVDVPFREIPDFIKSGKRWGFNRIDVAQNVLSKKSNCVTTNRSHFENYILNADKTKCRLFETIEIERLQTIPEGYTSCLNKTNAHKAIGNAWTVDVITHIFKEAK